MLSWCASAADGSNRMIFPLIGEIVTAEVFRIGNPDLEPVAVEIKAWFEVPDNDPVSIINFGADGSIVLSPGFDLDLGPFPLLPVTAGLPRGDYQLNCRFLSPITGKELALDVNPFEVH